MKKKLLGGHLAVVMETSNGCHGDIHLLLRIYSDGCNRETSDMETSKETVTFQWVSPLVPTLLVYCYFWTVV